MNSPLQRGVEINSKTLKAAIRIVNDALQMFGARGYSRDPVSDQKWSLHLETAPADLALLGCPRVFASSYRLVYAAFSSARRMAARSVVAWLCFNVPGGAASPEASGRTV